MEFVRPTPYIRRSKVALTKDTLPLHTRSRGRFVPPNRQLLRRPCLQPFQAKGQQVEMSLSRSLLQGQMTLSGTPAALLHCTT